MTLETLLAIIGAFAVIFGISVAAIYLIEKRRDR